MAQGENVERASDSDHARDDLQNPQHMAAEMAKAFQELAK